MGSICHSSVVSNAQSARDNDDANIDFSSQHDVSATWKLEGGVISCCGLRDRLAVQAERRVPDSSGPGGVVHLPGAVASAYTVDLCVRLIYRGAMSRGINHKKMGAGAGLLVWYEQKGQVTLGGPASLHKASLAQEGWAKGRLQPALGVGEMPPVFSGVLVFTKPVCSPPPWHSTGQSVGLSVRRPQTMQIAGMLVAQEGVA